MRINRLFRKIAIGLSIVFLFYLLAFYDTGYLTVQPGSAMLVEEMIEIENYPEREGDLYLLTVSQQIASPMLYLYSKFSNKVDLVPKGRVIPPDMDLEEYFQLSREMMNNSQLKAKYVALTYAGIDAEISSEGVLVEGILANGSAYGFLQENDIITEIEGQRVYFDEQVVTQIRQKEIGSTINIQVIRDGEILNLEVPVGQSGTSGGTPALGIWVRNKELTLTSPIDINIATGNIGGPSAGMMFVLEIYNRLTDGDITGGKKIAGTGEILWDRSIGPIGGMKQKVFAAENRGATILLCPVENYEEAILYATEIEVVAVSNFQQVLDYLNDLN